MFAGNARPPYHHRQNPIRLNVYIWVFVCFLLAASRSLFADYTDDNSGSVRDYLETSRKHLGACGFNLGQDPVKHHRNPISRTLFCTNFDQIWPCRVFGRVFGTTLERLWLQTPKNHNEITFRCTFLVSLLMYFLTFYVLGNDGRNNCKMLSKMGFQWMHKCVKLWQIVKRIMKKRRPGNLHMKWQNKVKHNPSKAWFSHPLLHGIAVSIFPYLLRLCSKWHPNPFEIEVCGCLWRQKDSRREVNKNM